MMPNGRWKPSPPTAPNTSTVDGSAPKPQVDALEQITLRTVGGVLGYPGPGGYTVSLVMLVAVSVAAVVWPPPFR